MANKKNSSSAINDLIANNKWEQVYRERDRLLAESISKLGERSKVDVLIGGLLVFPAYSALISMVKIMTANAKKSGAGKALNLHQMIKGIDANEFTWTMILLVVGLAFFYLALRKYDTIDKLTAKRNLWMPDKDEAAYIDKRFDNGFIRSILSKLSSEDTYSIEVGLDAVTVNNNTESIEFNYNKSGFNRLSNYDTKQLAFYLASHSFPDGFSIYQTKLAPVGFERFIGGTTEVGGAQPPKEDEERHAKKLYARLYEQLGQFIRIRNPFKVYLKDPGPAAVNNGHIVLNKGFKAEKEGYADL